MSGTKAGGLKCAAKNKLIYGDDFYKRIGSIGGKVRNPNKCFGSNHGNINSCVNKHRKTAGGYRWEAICV